MGGFANLTYLCGFAGLGEDSGCNGNICGIKDEIRTTNDEIPGEIARDSLNRSPVFRIPQSVFRIYPNFSCLVSRRPLSFRLHG